MGTVSLENQKFEDQFPAFYSDGILHKFDCINTLHSFSVFKSIKYLLNECEEVTLLLLQHNSIVHKLQYTKVDCKPRGRWIFMVPTSTFRVPDDFFMTRQLAKEPHQLAKKCTTE